MLLRAAEDVAWLDVPVSVSKLVETLQSTHSMAEGLHTNVCGMRCRVLDGIYIWLAEGLHRSTFWRKTSFTACTHGYRVA